MKKVLYILFSLVLFTSSLMAKEGMNQDALYIQLGGAKCNFSYNYEHCLWNRPIKDTNKLVCSANMTIGVGLHKSYRDENLLALIPIGVNYVIGDGKWATEVGAGITSYFSNSIEPIITSEFGLRYKPVKNNLIFKLMCTPYWVGNESDLSVGFSTGIVL